MFADITHALGLVRLRRVVSTNVSSELADDLLVDAFDGDLGVFGDGHFHALRDGVKAVMGLAKLKVNVGAFDRSTETHAVDFKIAGVALADADEHICDQTLGGAMQSAHFAVFGLASDVDGLCI